MRFLANSAEKMRITSGGDVLIGTTSIENPRGLAQALEIEAGSPVGIILNDSRDTHPMGIENAGAVMNFTYNTSPLMTILANGNVGIGTADPDHKLEVVGGLALRNSNSRLYFGTNNGTDRRALEGSVDGALLQVGES